MRIGSKNPSSLLLLLLVPSLATALSKPASYSSDDDVSTSLSGIDDSVEDASALVTPKSRKASSKAASSFDDDDDIEVGEKSRLLPPSRDAPRDGKDGKPHQGPFVETDRTGHPKDTSGKKTAKAKAGVMSDNNRDHPDEDTTGLGGTVSEKAKLRAAAERKTGGKKVVSPTEPIDDDDYSSDTEWKTKAKASKEDSTFAGVDTDDTPRTKDQDPPVGGSSSSSSRNKVHHWDSKAQFGSHKGTEEEGEEGIIQPFHSFFLAFTMILVSEIGDKTFLVAALMAMKHDRILVFTAAFSALVVMTVLSALLGHAVPTLIPKTLTSFLAAGLFFVFGARLLIEGMGMDPNEGVAAEMHEVEQELAEREKGSGRDEYAMEMGLGERGRANGRYSPPRSPSTSPQGRNVNGNGLKAFLKGSANLFSLLLSPAWVQTFVMTFLGEWGDRSQIATIAMSAGQDYWWVTLGSLCGHSICTGVAVIGGRAIAGKVSLKVVTIGGAVAFLLFGVIYLIEAFYA